MMKQDLTTLLFVNLTQKDYKRFFKAKISYSGSTGLCTVGYPKTAPYIASFLSELPIAIKAMKWRRTIIKLNEHGQLEAKRQFK